FGPDGTYHVVARADATSCLVEHLQQAILVQRQLGVQLAPVDQDLASTGIKRQASSAARARIIHAQRDGCLRPDEAQLHPQRNLELIAFLQLSPALEAFAVDISPVLAVEVLNIVRAAFPPDAQVLA